MARQAASLQQSGADAVTLALQFAASGSQAASETHKDAVAEIERLRMTLLSAADERADLEAKLELYSSRLVGCVSPLSGPSQHSQVISPTGTGRFPDAIKPSQSSPACATAIGVINAGIRHIDGVLRRFPDQNFLTGLKGSEQASCSLTIAPPAPQGLLTQSSQAQLGTSINPSPADIFNSAISEIDRMLDMHSDDDDHFISGGM